MPSEEDKNPPRRPAPARAVKTTVPMPCKKFPIVAIGASAGGLEALAQFLGHVPVGCGMAFVIIQHLDPDHKGMMPELLQRTTLMPVVQAKNRVKVRPDCVYVIPPNADLSILHDSLYLLEPIAPRGLRLPIDFFFRALADDRQEQAIGVILSGMGSDGTLGVRAIKERGGLVLAQDPLTAKFDSMPKSIIDAGLAEIIAAAEKLPQRIIDTLHLQQPAKMAVSDVESVDQKSAFDKICILLRERTGHDFSFYKKTTVYRRIERRMAIHQLDRIADYVHHLRENPQELDLLFKELLIGVTNFFRDPATWAYLQEKTLPDLLAATPPGTTLRAWVAGCSSGEEAYSLAIIFRELQEQRKPHDRCSLQIFATDLDPDAIEKARRALYPANIAIDVSEARLKRFFVEDGGSFRVAKEIREMVIFAPQNVLSDPPFTKLDLLTCRNLLIYLGGELQKRLLPLFHYSLNPGGILFLGSAETIGSFTDLFSPIDAKSRLYRRVGGNHGMAALEFPTRTVPNSPLADQEDTSSRPAPNLQSLVEQRLLQQFAPAAVLVNDKGDIIYISGRTGKYLEPAAGKANWNIHAMAREGLRHDLALALQKALRQGNLVEAKGLSVGTNGDRQHFDLAVQALTEPPELNGMALIVLRDQVSPPDLRDIKRGSARGARAAELETGLNSAREEIRTLREEMQTSQEELRSANEELQSTNEELQSTNEELTTSKEEMQSLNEELQTVNAELQSKVDDLSRTNNDMKNLLNSTDIATVFLDGLLRVRRFTTPTTRLIKLIPSDVGRPLSDIVSDLIYPEMQDDAREVLRSLVFSEKAITTNDGRWFTVKIMPYRTLDNVIDGVVITFMDISRAKILEKELRAVGKFPNAEPSSRAAD
jgi:two-component system CheB/CheR fusion protein